MSLPVDQHARDQALDPSHSVIIQAPAGSGKTGLLIRRYLKLLAQSEEPEQILCITFTRKATAEVRKRVIETLKACECGDPFEDDNELLRLSSAALANDREKGWDLVRNTRRLRIQTIDSLCSELVQRMPWSARFGAAPTIVEDAESLYREAAMGTLAHVDDNESSRLSRACNTVMTLLDANLGAGIDLLAEMYGSTSSPRTPPQSSVTTMPPRPVNPKDNKDKDKEKEKDKDDRFLRGSQKHDDDLFVRGRQLLDTIYGTYAAYMKQAEQCDKHHCSIDLGDGYHIEVSKLFA